MRYSTCFHRCRADVVQALRANESKCSLVLDVGHSKHPRQFIVVWAWSYQVRSALLVPDHLSFLWSSHSCHIRYGLHLHGKSHLLIEVRRR